MNYTLTAAENVVCGAFVSKDINMNKVSNMAHEFGNVNRRTNASSLPTKTVGYQFPCATNSRRFTATMCVGRNKNFFDIG